MEAQPDSVSSKILAAANAGKQRESFFSFGNEGLTATVGASGRLLRISRHFPAEKVGFCVDDENMPEPYYVVERLEELLSNAEDTPTARGIGAFVDSPNGPDVSRPVHVDMINHRWPTFHRISKDGTKFSVQYAASRDTVYQKFEFNNNSKAVGSIPPGDESPPLLMVRYHPLIRNLDFVDPDNEFNKVDAHNGSYNTQVKGNTIIRQHTGENDSQKVVLRIIALAKTYPIEFVSQRSSQEHSDAAEEAPCAIRRDTRMQKSNSEDSGGHTVILAYSLEYISKSDYLATSPPQVSWEFAFNTMKHILKPHCDHISTENSTLNFFLNRNLEYILSVCSIPVSTATSEEFTVEYALTCGDVDNHRVATSASL